MLFFSSPVIYPFAILLSFSLLYLISPQVLLLNPKPTPRQLSLHQPLPDRTLFLKALRVSSVHRISHSPTPCTKKTKPDSPKIAFLFLTNSDLTFSPLWERFFRGGNPNLYNLYVHADPTSQVKIPTSGPFKTQFIPGKKTCRGSPSLISAERRLLARAILDDPLNLYFALVSQHCIPLHSFNYIYNTLIPKGVTSESSSSRRLKSFIEIISKDPNLPDRYNARGEHVMLPEVPFEKFRVGSQFFILTKRHALMVLKDKKLWRKFRLPCLNVDSCYPEEHYFPTLLSMQDPRGCAGYTLTNVNWTGSVDGHPYLYRPEEISAELVHMLRRSNSTYSYFFARKFAPECLGPLMGIADRIIFRD